MKNRFLTLLLALVSAVSLFAGSDPGPNAPGPKAKGPILYGDTATMWTHFQNGTGVVTNNRDSSTINVTDGFAGGYIVTPLVDTTYTLTVTNPAGDSVTDSVAVTIQPVVMTAVSPATLTCSVSKTYTFTSSVSGALNATIQWTVDGIPGGDATVGTITATGNSVTYTAGTALGAHTIMAQSVGKNDVTSTASVTVVPLPTIDSAFTATPSTPVYGGTSVLATTFSHGTAVINGGATVNAPVTSPVSFTTPALIATTNYVVTVTNPAGDTATANVTVTITDAIMTDITPLTKNLSLTKTQAFAGGVVTNAADTSVVWKVNGVVGGNAELGFIDATGHYTAPATMPGGTLPATGNTITIRCESVLEPAVYKEAVITLYALPVITSFTVN